MEMWKDIEGYEGLYQVSNLGRVRSYGKYIKSPNGFRFLKGRILKTFKAGSGKREYNYVKLNKENTRETFSIHRLVAEAFLPNPDNKPEIDHIIPVSCGGTNEVSNLMWCTHKENSNNPLTRHKRRNNPKVSQQVWQYTLTNDLVAVYPSMHEAGRNGFGRKEIKKCCNGILKTHKGYKWSFTPL